MSKHEPNCCCHSTPPNWDVSNAVKLCISKAKLIELGDIPRGEDNIKQGIIAFDHISRQYYAIRHFPCFRDSYDCCCAAQAKELSGPNEKHEWEDIVFPVDEDDECPHCGQPRH